VVKEKDAGMNSSKIVLDVGQCGADHGSIRALCEGIGARVERAHTGKEALARIAAGGIHLVLVNRILDADGSDGVALISEIVARAAEPLAVMLVSNYPQFQEEAVSHGAVLGFGKSKLHSPETRELLKRALAPIYFERCRISSVMSTVSEPNSTGPRNFSLFSKTRS
jgi:hypothetical protein